MTEDTGFVAEAAPEAVPEPSAPEPEPEAEVLAGPPQPAAEPEDHVPPPWLPDTQPDWLREAFLSLHTRLRHLGG